MTYRWSRPLPSSNGRTRRSRRRARAAATTGSSDERRSGRKRQSLYQGRQVFIPGADMFRQRHTVLRSCSPTNPPHPASLVAHSAYRRSRCVAGEALVQVDRPIPGLADGPAPTPNTILRRMLALDGKAALRLEAMLAHEAADHFTTSTGQGASFMMRFAWLPTKCSYSVK